MSENLWTKSQRQAWGYVESAVKQGLPEVEALQQYREGGGKIRTASWVELYHRAQEASDRWSNLYQLKMGDEIPESYFERTGISFKEKYVMQFSTDVRLDTGEIIHSVHRQVESANRLTYEGWLQAAVESLAEDLSLDVSNIYAVRDLSFFERS